MPDLLKNVYVQYALKYNVSISRSLADRDFPLTEQELIQEFKNIVGRVPYAYELAEMSPDSEDTVRSERRHYRE